MDSSIEKEVLNDFENALANIDFKRYNPNSAEFITALNLGLMMNVMREISEDENINAKPINDISEEIAGARKYLQKYAETEDSIYKEMAGDELKHATILIKKAYSKLPNNEEKAKLKSYEDEVKKISELV